MKAKGKKFIIKEPVNPIVKLYMPVDKTKTKKARVRGFWCNEDGKVCYDYLRTINVNRKELRRIRKETGEKALFYRCNNKAYIYSGGNATCFKDYKKYIYLRGVLSFSELKKELKSLLKQYGRLTIYINKKSYQIEVWL